jgi:ParB-like chromosome segregation protein Spo0J
MEVRKLKLEEVKAYADNPRVNSVAIKPVADSIREYGYVKPILIDKDNFIIAGHTRLAALKLLGVKEIDCVVSELSAEQNKEFRLVDNKTHEYSSWVKGVLTQEARELTDSLRSFVDNSSKVNIKVYFEGSDITTGDLAKKRQELEGAFEENIEYIELHCKKCKKAVTIKK